MIDLYIRIESHDDAEMNRQMVFTGPDLHDVFNQAGNHFNPILSPYHEEIEVKPEDIPPQAVENPEGS